MKIVVTGGTGLIDSKVVSKLKRKGHAAIAAAPDTGVNTITGEGLADALAGARRRRRGQLAVIRGSGGNGFLSNRRKESPRGGGGRRHQASHRPLGRRKRAHARQRLSPCQTCPGEFDQELVNSLVLIILGMGMIAIATIRFVRTAKEIDDVRTHPGTGSRADLALAALLFCLAGGLLFYFVHTLAARV